MSLRQRASRHSRSSPSINWQFGSAISVILSPAHSLRPNTDKANLGIVTIQNESASGDFKRLSIERCITKIVRVKAQNEAVAAIRAQWEMTADSAVYGYERVDGAELVTPRFDA